MTGQNLYEFGAEYDNINFHGFWDWFVRITPLDFHWKHHPSYVVAQFAFIFGGVATLIHAVIRGGRLPYLWLGVVLHGLVTEAISYFAPDVDNFWHSQTSVMFLGLRLPLHIIFLYPCFIYSASVAVAKAKLPAWAEPFAVGLTSVLLDIPYDIISVNFLHWTWHDTDPNIADRNYWVPWNSYYFHATFAAGFTFFFHFTRRVVCNSNGKWLTDSFTKELLCTVVSAILGPLTGTIAFLVIYHPLHDIYGIHSEVTYTIICAIFLLIIWSADRTTPVAQKKTSLHWSTWVLLVYLILHYTVFLAIPVFFVPENEISIGLHERVGPCGEYVDLHTIFGMVLKKRKYLCATDYDEKYFDWHCLPGGKPPSNGSHWYTACGVPLPNKAEYIVITALISLVASVVFTNLHLLSFGEAVFSEGIERSKGKRKTN